MLTFKLDSEFNGNGYLFNAFDEENNEGKAYFTIDGLFCDVYKVEYNRDKLYIFQGLLKSCYNFAAGKMAYIGSLSDKSCFEEAKTMNFIFKDGGYSSDIPSLLMGTCCQEECSSSFYTED